MRKSWQVTQIPDLTENVVIITGANSGIGFEAARAIMRNGAMTVLACRDQSRAGSALVRLRNEIPDGRSEILSLDLASLSSIRAFAQQFRSKFHRLDILINNAGCMLAPYHTTADGFELHFGTNHLGHFALTGLLLDRLLATPNSRVVTVSSQAHITARMHFENLMFQDGNGYSPFRAYAQSKLANLLFSYELQRRLAGKTSASIAAHPGGAVTGLGRHMDGCRVYQALRPVMEWISQSPAVGALPILRAATDPGVVGGQVVGPSGFLGLRGRPEVVHSSRSSHDEAMATRLWDVSEQLTGISYLS